MTRVAREVGTEGKLGVQAQKKDIEGKWGEITDNVNIMVSRRSLSAMNLLCEALSKDTDRRACASRPMHVGQQPHVTSASVCSNHGGGYRW